MASQKRLCDQDIYRALIENNIREKGSFSVDFDGLWKSLGYSRKSNAKANLLRNYEESIDYIVTYGQSQAFGRQPVYIHLTTKAARRFAMLSKAPNGKLYADYFASLCEGSH